MHEQIIAALTAAKEPVTAKEIARSLPNADKSAVNRTLYALQTLGLAHSMPPAEGSKAPRWGLASQANAALQLAATLVGSLA